VAIAEALKVTLSGKAREVRGHTPPLPAYEAYLRGLHLVKQNTDVALVRSREFLEQAIALDPGYPEPHVALGESYYRLALEGVRPAREVMPHARAQAQLALALDPSNLDAQAILGCVAATYDYDWHEVERLWQTLGTRPDVPNAGFLGVDYLAPRRRISELVAWLERTLQHDPLNGLVRAILGSFLMLEARYDRALDELRTVLSVNDAAFSRASAHFVMAMVYGRLERPAEALAAAEQAYEEAPWHPRIVGMLAGALKQSGQHGRADEVIAPLRNAPGAHGVAMGMAQYHLVMGDVDGFVEWIEKAVEQREPLAAVYAGLLPIELLRPNPRWAAVMRTMNLEP
jgi:tetratricopeptide (TPR) repeat protein